MYCLTLIGQRLKPQHIGNMAAAFADHAGDIVLAVAEIVGLARDTLPPLPGG